MFSSRPLSKKGRNKQQPNANTKQTVCDIERRPMFARPVDNIDKVTHETAIKDSVVQIAANTGSEKAESNMNQSLPVSTKKQIRLAGQYSKSGAIV